MPDKDAKLPEDKIGELLEKIKERDTLLEEKDASIKSLQREGGKKPSLGFYRSRFR